MHPKNASKLKIEFGNFMRTIRLKRTTETDFWNFLFFKVQNQILHEVIYVDWIIIFINV